MAFASEVASVEEAFASLVASVEEEGKHNSLVGMLVHTELDSLVYIEIVAAAALVASLVVALAMNCNTFENMLVHMMVHMKHHKVAPLEVASFVASSVVA